MGRVAHRPRGWQVVAVHQLDKSRRQLGQPRVQLQIAAVGRRVEVKRHQQVSDEVRSPGMMVDSRFDSMSMRHRAVSRGERETAKTDYLLLFGRAATATGRKGRWQRLANAGKTS